MLRLRCALWLWLTTVAPALSFTLAPFTQRPRPSTTRIFSDEVDDVECAPNDDECVANLSDDDYSDDAGALEVIDDDAPDLTKLAQKNKLTKASWKLSLSIGRETGTWMPEEWAASGARLLLPIVVEFDSEPYPGEPEALVGQTCFRFVACVEINQCVECTFTKSFLGNDVFALAPSSGEGIDIATPSSRCRVDGVEVDAAIQDEHAVNLISTQGAARRRVKFRGRWREGHGPSAGRRLGHTTSQTSPEARAAAILARVSRGGEAERRDLASW